MAALLAGQSVSSVAREYDIPKGTVSGWKKKAAPYFSAVPEQNTTQKDEIGDLILQYLKETLRTLNKQAEFARTVEWLEKQPASELAVLHGVQMDKAIRLLEALSAADDHTAEG